MDNTNNKPLAEQVADRLIQYIIDSELKSGDKIPNEYQLSENLEVGRSTIREAVKLLVSRNILEIRRGAGTYVSKKKGIADDPLGLIFIKDKHNLAMDLLKVRLMMEPEIAGMAAQNATEEQIKKLLYLCDKVEERIEQKKDHTEADIEFHTMIAKCSKNMVVEKLIPIINSAVMVFVNITKGRLRNETIETHREIAEAIRDRDVDGAKGAMSMHLNYNRRLIVKIIKEHKETNSQT